MPLILDSTPGPSHRRVIVRRAVAIALLGMPSTAVAFLFTPHPALGGLAPAVVAWRSDALARRAKAVLL